MAKKVLYNEEARAALLKGVDQLANAVKISAHRTSLTTVFPLPVKSN